MKALRAGLIFVAVVLPISLFATSDEGYIELLSLDSSVQGNIATVQLTIALHFPNYTIPGFEDSHNAFNYQILLQMEDDGGNLVYSRTVTRRLDRFPVGQTDTLSITFRVPKGNYRLFLTPLNIPVYIRDLSEVPLPLAQRQIFP